VRYNLLHIKEATFIDDAKIGDCAVMARSIYAHGFLTGKYSTEEAFPFSDHRRRKFNPEIAAKVQAFFRETSSVLPKETGKQFEIPLRYAMSSPNISVVIVGATSEQQIKENIAVIEKSGLADEMRQAIRRVAERIFGTAN
jgi:aryl-alcohol dehydrogenase-like predicted oxidoreductase